MLYMHYGHKIYITNEIHHLKVDYEVVAVHI